MLPTSLRFCMASLSAASLAAATTVCTLAGPETSLPRAEKTGDLRPTTANAPRPLPTYAANGQRGGPAFGQSGDLEFVGDCVYLVSDRRYLLIWPDTVSAWAGPDTLRFRELDLRDGMRVEVRGLYYRGASKSEWPANAVVGCDYSNQQIVVGLTVR